MYRNYLDRRPKRRGESSVSRRTSSVRIADRETIHLSPHRITSLTNDTNKEIDMSRNLESQTQYLNNNEPDPCLPSINIYDEENCVPLPEANSLSRIIINGNIRQLTSLPTNIQLNNSSSSISSMTTSLFDVQVSSTNTDDSSSKSSNTNHISLNLSAEEKSQRLSLFTKPTDII